MRSAALAFALLALAGPAAAQTADGGWDVAGTADTVVASVGFENGITVAAQCRSGQFRLAITGLARIETRERSRVLETGFDAANLSSETWQTAEGGSVALSPWAGKRARGLRRGGTLIVRTDPTGPRLDLPLPSDPSGLDRALTACGQPLSDSRDDLLEAGPLLVNPNWASRPPAMETGARGEAEMTCIIAPRGRVQDCRIESETPTGQGIGAGLLRDARNVRLNFGDNAQAAVGRIILLHVASGRSR